MIPENYTISDENVARNLNILTSGLHKKSVNFRVTRNFKPDVQKYENIIKTNNFILAFFLNLPRT